MHSFTSKILTGVYKNGRGQFRWSARLQAGRVYAGACACLDLISHTKPNALTQVGKLLQNNRRNIATRKRTPDNRLKMEVRGPCV